MNYSKSKNKAIFLDRDGVIFREVDHLWRIQDAKFLPGVIRALQNVPPSFKLVIITNQAGIAKGLYTTRDYHRLNNWMLTILRSKHIRITKVYFCPHHPNAVIKKYKKICSCRKPKVGLFKKAARNLHLNLRESWSIGDKTSDIIAGKRAGSRTVLVKTGYGGKDKLFSIRPDFYFNNLTGAVNLISHAL